MSSKTPKTAFQQAEQKVALIKKHQEKINYYQRLRNRRLMDMAALFPKMSEKELKMFIRKYASYILQLVDLRVRLFKTIRVKLFEQDEDYLAIQEIIAQARKNNNKIPKEKTQEFIQSMYNLCRRRFLFDNA